MRIKRIEVIGFKSFSDKVSLLIDQPITTVVGPNGCGKSNVVDAIRWCMGEQSAKHLRGRAMEDVIFAGSETRDPAGMAEVALTFENVAFEPSGLEPGDDERQDNALASGAPEAPSEDGPQAEATAGPEHAAEPGADPAPGAAAEPGAGADPEPDADPQPAPVLDFTQYGEVRVTRRLYRDGTSEYLINNAPCRLRDVTDFFLGTGVGTKAYSIIEQGRIGMIVSAKPADRRLIIEEAAGITKFKKRKQAAERKMQQTRQNLLRVSDIVQELRSRLGSLRRQAQKAERYKHYKGELRDIELWSASHQLLAFNATDRVLREGLQVSLDERDAKIVDQEKREAAIIAERADCSIEERSLTELTETVFELENQTKLAQSQIEYQRREAKDLDERALASRGEIDALTRQIEANREETGKVFASKETLEAQANERRAELGELEQRQETARAAVDEAQATLDAARTEIADAQALMASSGQKQAALEGRRDDLELRLGRITDEHGGLLHRQGEVSGGIHQLNQTLGGLRQMKLDIGVQKEGLEVRLAELKEQHEKSEAEVETLRTEAHRRRSRLQSLSEIQERYEGFARGTRAVMRHQSFGADQNGVRGLVADIVDAPAEYEAAVEAILGDRIGSILVDSQAVSVEAIDYLKTRSEGRSTFIPLSTFSVPASASPGSGLQMFGAGDRAVQNSVIPDSRRIQVVGGDGVRGPIGKLVRCKKEYTAIADYLFRDVVVVESLARAIELWEAGLRKTLVTLDGDIVDAQGVVTGGSREATGAGVLQQKREIRELEEIIGALDQDLANATSRHVSCKTELSRVGAALEAAKKESHQGEMDLLAQEKDLSRWQAESERHRERRRQLESERDELEDSLRQVVRDLSGTLQALVTATQKSGDAQSVKLSLIEKMASAREHLEQTHLALTECRVKQAQIDAECASVQDQYRRLGEQGTELADRQQKLQAKIGDSTQRAQSLRKDAAELEVKLETQSESRGARAEELQTRRSTYERRLAALQIAEVEVRSVRGDAEKLRAEVQSIETERHELAIEMRHLDESIWERHRVQLAQVVTDFHLRALIDVAEEERLKELRRLIERMGEVNLTAIGEFEELSTRHEFLTTQKADLEGALAQLERAITKINRTSRRLFKETFEEVNRLFQELFPRLFRGGRAYLRLTEEQDLLDAGVEIFAQPPGKKNSTVELLSGGEKALTAVSLIFAVFLHKPSPFCILDEVDAPLDEANVDRFCDLIRELTGRSQFIVITHNKRTMEIADRLYGVTMQEPGCSKLVSVNLRGFAKEAA